MPELRVVEMGYNYLTRLCGDKSATQLSDSAIELINLDANQLSDWTHIWTSLKEYKSYVFHYISAIAVLSLSSFRVKFTARCLDFQYYRKYTISRAPFRPFTWYHLSFIIREPHQVVGRH